MTLKFGVKFFSTFIVRTNSGYGRHVHKASRLSLCPQPVFHLRLCLIDSIGSEASGLDNGRCQEESLRHRWSPRLPVERALKEEAVAAKEDEGVSEYRRSTPQSNRIYATRRRAPSHRSAPFRDAALSVDRPCGIRHRRRLLLVPLHSFIFMPTAQAAPKPFVHT
jgi:hypothetical protein